MEDELIRFLTWLKQHNMLLGQNVPGSPYGWLSFVPWEGTPEQIALFFREEVGDDMSVKPQKLR